VTDLNEAKYSADQLKTMAGKGHAMKNENGDPSYPIADKEDLQKAIQAVGRGGGSHDAIRKHIMSRAKALKMESMVPKDWSSASTPASKKGANPLAAKEATPFGKKPPPATSKTASKAASDESASAETLDLVELGEAVKGTGRRRKIQLIQAGWSKNGRYYPAEALAEAARNRIFPAGTPMYADHPTLTEKIERPERSIRDLAARLDSDARYENGALVSEATSFGTWNQVLNGPDGLAENVEVSVRCFGEITEGTAEGREGMIVRKITEGRSVDFVTEGAAGGKVLELLEAAQKDEIYEAGSVGASIEARIHTAFTIMCDEMYACGRITRDERIGLSTSVGDALGAFVSRVERDQPQLYERETWQDPDQDIGEAAADTGSDPDQTPADVLAGTETSEEPSQKGTEMTESQNGAAPTPGTTRALVAAELAEARRERDLAVARETARALIPRALVDAYIPPSTAIRITESVMAQLPMKDGHLDEAALYKEVARQVEQGEREMAEALQAAGVGSPRDLGSGSPATQGYGVDSSEMDDRLGKAFSGLGMTESAVKHAVQGRG
jgi:hypothetical protein